MKKRIFIQMYGTSENFTTIADENDFYEDLSNVELGSTLLIKIVDTNNKKHYINPKYIAWINFDEVKDD